MAGGPGWTEEEVLPKTGRLEGEPPTTRPLEGEPPTTVHKGKWARHCSQSDGRGGRTAAGRERR